MQPIWYLKLSCLIILVSALTISSAGAYSTDFPKNYNLWEGSAAMHEIGVYGSCDSIISIVSPYEASFDLYAIRNHGSPGTCPSNLDIMTHYDKVAYSTRGRASLILEEGLWCVVVHARSGAGSVYVTADSNCDTPYPTPTPVPYPTPCSPYKTIDRSGYLYQGQAAVYGYSIPDEGRSLIDWRVTGDGSCGDVPIMMSSVENQVMSSSSQYPVSSCGNVFEMYVFKDCNPQYSYCTTNYYSKESDNVVSIPNPARRSVYYVMVYARSGSGSYNLRMNSYTCYRDTPIIIASSPEIQSSSSTWESWINDATSVDSADTSVVAAPTADFVQALPE